MKASHARTLYLGTVWLVFATAIAIVIGQGQHIGQLEGKLRQASIEREYLRGQLFQALGLVTRATGRAGDFAALADRYREEILLLRFVERVRRVNPLAPARRIASAVLSAADSNNLDPVLLLAVVEQESHYNVLAVGTHEERGLMQLTPAIAQDMGLSLSHAFDIEANIAAGAKFLAMLLNATDGNIRMALARYNGDASVYPRLVTARMLQR